MAKVIIRKINLDNFRFELLDNDLVKEMKDCLKSEHNRRRLLSKEPGNPHAPGRNNHVHAEMPLG